MSEGDARGAAVEVRAVSRHFGTVLAVDSVSLDVDGGTMLALVGPSGCGKTTLLRCIAGFEVPDAGSVSIGGVVVAGEEWVPPERRRVGMLFQQLALFPHLDVAGNIAYGLRGLGRTDRRRRVGELLDLVGLAGLEGRRPDELSGGQAQRVALARALAPGPAVVLLDEPFSSLDVGLRAGVRAEVRRILREAGTTSILVSHDQDEALSMGDEVAVMLGGRLVQRGRPEDVYRSPASAEVAAFLGDANLFDGVVDGDMVRLPLGTCAAPAGLTSGQAVRAVVRPEDVEVDVIVGVAQPGGERAAGTAEVVDVEYYGHDQVVWARLHGQSAFVVRARLHARQRVEVGAIVALALRGTPVVWPADAP